MAGQPDVPGVTLPSIRDVLPGMSPLAVAIANLEVIYDTIELFPPQDEQPEVGEGFEDGQDLVRDSPTS